MNKTEQKVWTLTVMQDKISTIGVATKVDIFLKLFLCVLSNCAHLDADLCFPHDFMLSLPGNNTANII